VSRYVMLQDKYVQEFDLWLAAGTQFEDGDLEPDLVASLVSQEFARSSDALVIPAGVEEAAPADEPDEEAKPRRGR